MESNSYLILIPFLCFVCYCVLLIILIGSRKNKIARHYAFYIISMVVWSFGAFVMRANFPPGPLFWNRILCVGLISMPVIFYHFTLVLTDTINQKNKLYFGYISGALLIIGNFSGFITAEAYVERNYFYYTLGPGASLMALWSLSYLLLAFINIINKVKSKEIPIARVKLILMGSGLMIFGGLLNLFPSLGRYPLDILLNTFNAFFIAYSIYRYRFLEIKLIVKKGMAYSLYTLSLTGAYIIAIFGVQQIFIMLLGDTSMFSTLVIAVILALVFQPVKDIIQKWIDRLFYKESLNHQIILRDFSKIINNQLDLEELTDSLLKALQRGLKPRKIHLLLRQGKDEYVLFNPTAREDWMQDIKYNGNHPIIQWFLQGKSLLTLAEIENLPYFTGLWRTEKKQLYRMETELIVAIKLRETLIGLIILSDKMGGEAYSHGEMDFLFTLVNNAAVVIENAKLYEEAKRQAITDGLTKLYNHRYFHEVLGQYIKGKTWKTFSVAMIDVDLFKLYNDLYGHSAGDRALAKIAEVLREATGEEDIIARYGGEEFAIILPNIDADKSLKAIETIRRAVENKFYSAEYINEFLTVSIGVASYPRDGSTPEEILDCADKAMYAAKQNGRNQCMIYARHQESQLLQHNDELEIMQDSIKSAYFSAIYALAATIDAKDHYTYGHSENVSRYSVALGRAAGFTEEQIDIVRSAGLLHDIGKIGVPEAILTKTTPLTPEEFEIMKKHVDISITIIKHVPNLVKMIPAIMCHHERFDGKGYPRGIKGESIPIEGRCLAIVDAFDAMTTDRPYRKALSIKEALGELEGNSGTQFDPELTKIFIRLFDEGKIEVA
ncbi:diguanylate cyclase [Alkaliphilus crotonatoxidans]